MTGRLLDAKEIAELLNVPTSWVLEHARNDTIPHVRLGRYVRFDEHDVREWLATCRRGGKIVKLRRYDAAQ